MQRALEISKQAPLSKDRYSVGALLTDSKGGEVATGYTSELRSGQHAEECALEKVAARQAILTAGTIYTTIEPCSLRLSGQTPCVRRILAAGLARVVMALPEPASFVHCEGRAFLAAAGIEVVELPEFAAAVLDLNQHLLKK